MWKNGRMHNLVTCPFGKALPLSSSIHHPTDHLGAQRMILADWTLRWRQGKGKLIQGAMIRKRGNRRTDREATAAQLVKRIPSMSSSFSRGGRRPRQERPRRARILSKKPDLDLLLRVPSLHPLMSNPLSKRADGRTSYGWKEGRQSRGLI